MNYQESSAGWGERKGVVWEERSSGWSECYQKYIISIYLALNLKHIIRKTAEKSSNLL